MDYTLIISICSVLVMFFSAYVAYKSYVLQKGARRPIMVYFRRKYEFQFYIKDDQFHLVQWLISANNSGGETAIVDSILFSVKINHVMYLGKVDSAQFKYNLVPPGALFIVDLSSVLRDKNTWALKRMDEDNENNTNWTISGVEITELTQSEAASMMLCDMSNMSYRASIHYRLNGTDITTTQPFRLNIEGSIKEDRRSFYP